jgi:hypothetical protein
MHTRDYSEDTSKVIDDEVERILRSEEQRAMEALSKHRGGLNAIARALLDNEIIDGAEVARLVDEAHGSPVHGEGAKSVPHFHEAAISAPPIAGNGAGSGTGAGAGAGAANGHGASAEAGAEPGVGDAVAVPATPTPSGSGAPSEAPSWPPPVWPPPPADPAHGTPEGSGSS